MTKLQKIKAEILSTWTLKEGTRNWVSGFPTIREIRICLNDLTGHIVWDAYPEDTKKNRDEVREKLLEILDK